MVQWVKNPACNAADTGPGNQDPTRRGETKPVCSNYWALEPQLESLCTTWKRPEVAKLKKKKNYSNILVYRYSATIC